VMRVRNADDFLREFRKIRERYETYFGPRIADIRNQYRLTPVESTPVSVDENLEAHSRVYVVNSLLSALNWRLDSSPDEDLPNLLPEAPVFDLERGTTRFLDYLGLEHKTNAPLLIVETKRPSSELPRLKNPRNSTPEEIVSQGLRGMALTGGWSKWFNDIKDYVRVVHQQTNRVPKRVIVTNGDWLILFLDPSDAFLNGIASSDRILVFSNRDDVENRYLELFRHVEHNAVLGQADALELGELAFNIPGRDVDRIMHGLRLRYFEEPGLWMESVPSIKITPVLFIRSRFGAWLRIEGPRKEFRLPQQEIELGSHFNDVRNAAEFLLNQVRQSLEITLTPSPLWKHYGDEDSFEPIRGVYETKKDEFTVATGDNTHYFLPEPSVPNCLHHNWVSSNAIGVASNPAVFARRTNPRSYFFSTEVHHCAHRDVANAKSSAITAENLSMCGLRSGKEGQAFCEIWRFEQHLCCRTCSFEMVCTKAAVFKLPCTP